MKKIAIQTTVKKMLADVFTPVGIYLRLRDRFRDTVLLESSDHHVAENSYSFIGIQAIAGIEVHNYQRIETKYPLQKEKNSTIAPNADIATILQDYMAQYDIQPPIEKEARFAQGLYGYFSYDCIPLFEKTKWGSAAPTKHTIPLVRFRLYQYVIAINHHNDDLYLCENHIEGLTSESPALENILTNKNIPVFPFSTIGEETTNMNEEDYIKMIHKGIAHCLRGDVFQVVLGRAFQQRFKGDDFNVYRALRNINPSPYLFYFDYGEYHLFGSSPESQLIVKDGIAVVHPIAGTFRRTGNDVKDQELAANLLNDAKENAEHVMLVDLARNDLSRVCDNVTVKHLKEVKYYSHVIHMVSEVVGKTKGSDVFNQFSKTFPAGTLSGAPKVRAMEIIADLESSPRGYYGGAIGFIGFDSSCNLSIMIRTFLSKNNTLHYRAGGGIVAASNPQNELAEINNKLGALKKAIVLATTM